MYDELVKRVRQVAEEVCEGYDVDPYHAEQRCFVIEESADAIEDLEFACNRYEKDYKALCAYLPKWIPVTERLPKYGERVLVFGGVTMYVAYYDKNRYGGESWHKLNSKSHYCNPTHWMPLPSAPEPPKEE